MDLYRSVSLVPWALFGVVWVMDSLPVAGDSTLAVAMIDEPAHLSTALLVLIAAVGLDLRHRAFLASAALGSVLIDLDHIPLYAGIPHVAQTGGRPFSHSLATPLVLALVVLAAPRARAVLSGLSVGVLLHLVRDLATGPGVPLWWPLDFRSQTVPHRAYMELLVALAAIGSWRLWTHSRVRSRRAGTPA